MHSSKERLKYIVRVEGPRRSGIPTSSKVCELDNGSRGNGENVD